MTAHNWKEGFFLTLSLRKLNTITGESVPPEDLLNYIAELKKRIFKISKKYPWEIIKREGTSIQWFIENDRINAGNIPDINGLPDELNKTINGFEYRSYENLITPSFGLCFGEVSSRKVKSPHFTETLMLSESAVLSDKFAHEKNDLGFPLLLDAAGAAVIPGSRIVDGYRTPGFTKLKILYGSSLDDNRSEKSLEYKYKDAEAMIIEALEALFLEDIARAAELLGKCLEEYPGYRTAEVISERISNRRDFRPLRSYHISWL